MEARSTSGGHLDQVDEVVVHTEGRGVEITVWGVGVDLSVVPPIQVCPGRQSSHARVEGVGRLLVEHPDEGGERREEKLAASK